MLRSAAPSQVRKRMGNSSAKGKFKNNSSRKYTEEELAEFIPDKIDQDSNSDDDSFILSKDVANEIEKNQLLISEFPEISQLSMSPGPAKSTGNSSAPASVSASPTTSMRSSIRLRTKAAIQLPSITEEPPELQTVVMATKTSRASYPPPFPFGVGKNSVGDYEAEHPSGNLIKLFSQHSPGSALSFFDINKTFFFVGNRWVDEPRFLSQEYAIDPYSMKSLVRKTFPSQDNHEVSHVLSSIGTNMAFFNDMYLAADIQYRNVPLLMPEKSRVCKNLPNGHAFEWCGCDRIICDDNVAFLDRYCYSCRSRYEKH